MGTPIVDILEKKDITIEDLRGKVLAVDTYNLLYQFIASIRQQDGTPLMDSKGRVTSHLTGLFSRITKLMQEDIKFVFVFDGKVPELKKAERERRKAAKVEAAHRYEEAKSEENIEDMKKYASRTSKLTAEMVAEAKEVIAALGMPIVDAPSEGEAQASYMVAKGDAYAIVSQDTDSLIFGADLVVKNLTLSGKRKLSNRLAYSTINPQLVSLSDSLNKLGISLDQLRVIAILTGTDYNIGGIKGIGPKKALKLVQDNGEDFEKVFEEAKWNEHFDVSWKEIFDIIKDMKTTDDYELKWDNPDKDELVRILVDEHNFNLDRVNGVIEKLLKGRPDKMQKGLSEFF